MNDPLRAVSAVTMIVMISSAVASAFNKDWMWTIISLIGMVMVMIPRMSTIEWSSYHLKIMVLVLVPYTLFLFIFIMNLMHPFELYGRMNLAIQTFAAFMCGYMLMIAIDVNTETVLTKRWLTVFALAFACAFAVLYAALFFVGMSEAGYPLYNEDFEGPDAADRMAVNRILMLPINIAVICSIIYAAVVRIYTEHLSKDDITRFYGGYHGTK